MNALWAPTRSSRRIASEGIEVVDKRFVIKTLKLNIRIRLLSYTFNYPTRHTSWNFTMLPSCILSKLGKIYSVQLHWLSWELINAQFEHAYEEHVTQFPMKY